MSENFEVNAEVRTDQGKGASRRLRRDGKVPAILYGGNEDPQQLALNHAEMVKHLQTEAFYSHILTLKLDGKEQQAVLKDVQRHPAKPLLMHFDFQRVLADVAIRMHVPLHFTNETTAPGVKTGGGIVEHHLTEVVVECLPRYLPEFLEVDLGELNVNESLHLSQIKLPENVALVELKHGNDKSVVSIHLPRAPEEEAAPAPAAAAETPAAGEGAAPAAAPAAEAKKEEKKK